MPIVGREKGGMSMERLTKKVDGVWTALCKYGSSPYPVVTQEIIDRLAAYEDTGFTPEEVQQMRWIPVEERLPEPGERVLATDCGFVGEFYINKRGKWQRYNVNCSELLMALDILYWMPLPAPPSRRPPEGEEET